MDSYRDFPSEMDLYNGIPKMFESFHQKIYLLNAEWTPSQAQEASLLLNNFVEIRSLIEQSLASTRQTSEEISTLILHYIIYWEQFESAVETQIGRWVQIAQEANHAGMDSVSIVYNALMWTDRLNHDLLEQLELWELCISGGYSLSLNVTSRIAQAVVQLLESLRRLSTVS